MLKKIALLDIQDVTKSELNPHRLTRLQSGSFEQLLNITSEPIQLDGRSRPYGIVDGRHRIHIAREKGYSFVLAKLL